jgi:hypothetical protein
VFESIGEQWKSFWLCQTGTHLRHYPAHTQTTTLLEYQYFKSEYLQANYSSLDNFLGQDSANYKLGILEP